MKNSRMLAEIGKWAEEGLIDAATRDTLAARYAKEPNAKLRSTVLLSIAALLVGLGVITVVAANWSFHSRFAKTASAFLPLAACVALWIAGMRKNWKSRAFLEPLGVLWTASIVFAHALVGQIYQVSGRDDQFALSSALLALPVVYATRAFAPALAYFVGLFAWVCLRADLGANSQLYWVFAALALPAFAMIRRDSNNGARYAALAWCASLLSVAALGFTLEKVTPGLWMIIYSSAFAALLLGGECAKEEDAAVGGSPMRTIGGVGLGVTLFLLTFQWPWEDIGWRANRWHKVDFAAQAYFDYAAVVLLPAISTALLAVIWRRRRRVSAANQERGGWALAANTALGASPLAVALLYAVFSQSAMHGDAAAAATVMSLVFTVIAFVALLCGTAIGSLAVMNGGLAGLLALILAKFLMDEYPLTIKGLVFIATGAALFFGNWMTSKKRRAPK